LKEHAAFIFRVKIEAALHPENGASMVLRNVGSIQRYMASKPRITRLKSHVL